MSINSSNGIENPATADLTARGLRGSLEEERQGRLRRNQLALREKNDPGKERDADSMNRGFSVAAKVRWRPMTQGLDYLDTSTLRLSSRKASTGLFVLHREVDIVGEGRHSPESFFELLNAISLLQSISESMVVELTNLTCDLNHSG